MLGATRGKQFLFIDPPTDLRGAISGRRACKNSKSMTRGDFWRALAGKPRLSGTAGVT